MREVPLSGRRGAGLVALVDDEDWEGVSGRRWFLHSAGYAIARNGSQMVLMHRLILDPPDGTLIDHINRHRLDNRRANLRPCTHAENLRNRSAVRTNLTGVKGVRRLPNGRWQARITVMGIERHVGNYATAEEAAAAYDAYCRGLHGEFAKTNGDGTTKSMKEVFQARTLSCRNKSGFRGVRQRTPRCWAARINACGVETNIGHFPTAEQAARAYDQAALKLYGDGARLNFPEP